MATDAKESYEALAPGYDRFTSANDYEMWLGEVLLPELEKRGLRGKRAFDVGCGTGKAFGPLLGRGWEVVGCDVSPAMLEEARRKFGDAVPVSVADVRELPVLGSFDLVLALNDVVNYLTEDGDLERGLAGMRANLAATGLLVFDSNSLAAFRSAYSPTAQAGGVYEMTVSGAGFEPHTHRQRHFTFDQLRGAMSAAGLDCLAMLGQQEAEERVLLDPHPDDERDDKIVCIARRSSA